MKNILPLLLIVCSFLAACHKEPLPCGCNCQDITLQNGKTFTGIDSVSLKLCNETHYSLDIIDSSFELLDNDWVVSFQTSNDNKQWHQLLGFSSNIETTHYTAAVTPAAKYLRAICINHYGNYPQQITITANP